MLRLSVLLALAFALFSCLSPLAAQSPPQVAGVQLAATSSPAPSGYTLAGQFGGQLSTTATANGKVTSFTLNGATFTWDHRQKNYVDVWNPARRYIFVYVSEGHYRWYLEIWGTLIGSGTATAN